MEKKMVILVGFFSVLTLVSSVITSSLVFFNEKARTEANSNKVLIEEGIYKNTSINYERNNTLNLSDLTPGYSVEHQFSITNNNSNTIKYNIEWTNVASSWNVAPDGMESHPEEFVYSITCTSGDRVNEKQMPTSDGTILENLELKTNKSNDCVIKVTFKNTGLDQSYNNNKSFKGTYKVVIKE